MKLNRLLALTTLCCGLQVARVSFAADFEGTIKLRALSVDTKQLSSLVGEQSTTDAAKLFAIPMDKLLALKGQANSSLQVLEPTIAIKGAKVRADGVGREHDQYVLMDLDKKTTWLVMPKDKKYFEWSAADVQALNTKMEAMQKELESRLATLPPEQRKQVEAMMKGMPGGSGAAPKVDLRPLGTTETINGMSATAFEVRNGGEQSVGWVTQEHKDLMQAFKALQESQEKMTPGHHGQKSDRLLLAERGLPVRVQTLDGGQYRVEDVLDVKKQAVPADLFTIPAGFEKTTGQQMMKQAEHGGAGD